MKNLILAILIMISGTSVAQSSHEVFNKLLQENVDSNGMVDYINIKKEIASLDKYLNTQRLDPPNDSWAEDEKLSYWINLYNALTIKLVTDFYPIKSIKDIGSLIQVPFVNTPWDIELFEIAGEKYSLNDIEHGVIRKEFEEPRIHFALVCAAISCPNLRNESYKATSLNEQLSDQTRIFLDDQSKNIITEKKLKLSNIFNWYGGDFRKSGTLNEFLDEYTATPIDQKAKTSFMTYLWDLNEQKATN